jgi:hypothetical protein
MAMEYPRAAHLTDAQLETVLYETGNWMVDDIQGRHLCWVPSLRLALEVATDYARTMPAVVTLSRAPVDDVVIFPGQVERLRKIAATLESNRPDPERSEITTGRSLGWMSWVCQGTC